MIKYSIKEIRKELSGIKTKQVGFDVNNDLHFANISKLKLFFNYLSRGTFTINVKNDYVKKVVCTSKSSPKIPHFNYVRYEKVIIFNYDTEAGMKGQVAFNSKDKQLPFKLIDLNSFIDKKGNHNAIIAHNQLF